MSAGTQKNDLPKAYEFPEVERKWLGQWEAAGLFTADSSDSAPPFSMVIPPPNVTGVLHIGHALNNTLQDILARYKRMDGHATLWVPGTDHAGIATQNVVERQIAAEGHTRHDLGRERFIGRVWSWKAESGGTIIGQLKRLGCSCDWTRERFTMDEGLSRAVREVFVRLYEEGLIYKGDYIINWCPRCHTALADIEVEHEPREGNLWFIRYPLADREGFIIVATTRPETMLGDTAVAVHPGDDRYRALVGAEVILPLVDRRIPIVADEAVEMEFGTGAVKVTPAHDLNDFEISRRHGLPAIDLFDKSARTTDAAGRFSGLDRYEARKAVVEAIEDLGLLERVEPHSHAVGTCYRCGTGVEPRLSKQWFVRTRELAGPALEAVRTKRTTLIPSTWERTYEEWMTNIRDWCISRQIWWGHRIPAWECTSCGEIVVARETPAACPKCGSPELRQEEDVLDTWFSSALWPFSTLGWPDKTPELAKFYPTSVLVTSFDILFFWVARMVMMGIHFMGEVPFRKVYLHALVRDAQGQKMSKSKGNVIDPIAVMDKYGADAVRFTLAVLAAQGRDIKLADERIEGYRHFVNKIWNASRFVLMNTGTEAPPPPDMKRIGGGGFVPEAWIITRLERLIETVRNALDSFDFDVASREIYQFFWHEYCDWYLELAKPSLASEDPAISGTVRSVTFAVLETSLRLLHPFMPFVTEELWHHLPGTGGWIAAARFPETSRDRIDEKAEAEIGRLIELVTGLRNLRAELGVHPGGRIPLVAVPHDDEARRFLESYGQALSTLARVESVSILDAGGSRPRGAASLILRDLDVFIPLTGLVDITEELGKLDRETRKLADEIKRAESRLENGQFLSKAPADVVAKERERLDDARKRHEKVRSQIHLLRSIDVP